MMGRVAMNNPPVTVIGAGPAGLAAAYELVNQGIKPLVIEAGADLGGIARTVTYQGCRFDIGGHRFFTKLSNINKLWRNMLGPDLRLVQRKSSILYNGRFFAYPLRTANTIQNLGIVESSRVLLSYLQAQLFPNPVEDTFDLWMSNRFGSRLFRIFFKAYTEKVWGLPCSAIQADWAAQRIKGLSMIGIVTKALFGTGSARTLIDCFHYPKTGPGMMWDRFGTAIVRGGGAIQTEHVVTGLKHVSGFIKALQVENGQISFNVPVEQVISSMPITNLIQTLDPPAPREVQAAAQSLTYRALVMAGLILNRDNLFADQWIYIHDPDVQVGRIQNFKNWSPEMAGAGMSTNIGMEYFCNEGDPTWSKPDEVLIDMAARELEKLGLASRSEVIDGLVIRQAKAYPVYRQDYRRNLLIIRRYLDHFENLQTIGRNGTHRYNNMDHSMQSGIRAARNTRGMQHDLWQVNADPEYLEKTTDLNVETDHEDMVTQVFTHMDKIAFGTAVGLAAGLIISLATFWLVIKGGPVVGPRLSLLAQYYPGYTVTLTGSLVGFLYGFATGFSCGWIFALLRNFLLVFYLFKIRKIAEYNSLKDLLDRI